MGSGDTEGEEVWQELRKNSEKGTDYSDNVQKGGILNLALSKKFGEGTLSSTMGLISYAALPDYVDYESDESISFVIRDRQDERGRYGYTFLVSQCATFALLSLLRQADRSL